MTVYWIRTENDSALSAMAAVEQALMEGDTGSPAAATIVQAPEPACEAEIDPYLAENLATLHTRWPVDPHQIVVSSRPGLARAINVFQQLVHRATWWYNLPQWQQISEFHAASVRVIDSLMERQRQLRELALQWGMTPIGRTQALEEQIHLLRMEQLALQNRIAELEERLVAKG
jgi:hypothetical protein